MFEIMKVQAKAIVIRNKIEITSPSLIILYHLAIIRDWIVTYFFSDPPADEDVTLSLPGGFVDNPYFDAFDLVETNA
jgi:hypothetical protein